MRFRPAYQVLDLGQGALVCLDTGGPATATRGSADSLPNINAVKVRVLRYRRG